MNGKLFDKFTGELSIIEPLLFTDKIQFCKDMFNFSRNNKWVLMQRDNDGIYRSRNAQEVNDHLDNIVIVKDAIVKNDFDNEVFLHAEFAFYFIFRVIYDQFANDVRKYKRTFQADINKYKKEQNLSKITHQILQTLIIIGAATVPLILNIVDIPKIIPTFISILVAISAAIISYYKLGEKAINTLMISEKMQREYNLYESERGHYSDLTPGAAFDLFLEKMDELKHEQIEIVTRLEKRDIEHDGKRIEPKSQDNHI